MYGKQEVEVRPSLSETFNKTMGGNMKRYFLLGLGIFVALMVSAAENNLKAQCVDSMIVSDGSGNPGDTGIRIPVYGRVCGLDTLGNFENLDGLVFCMEWDTSCLTIDSVLYEVTDPVYQSFYDVIPNPNNMTPVINNSEGWVTVGIVFSYVGTPDVPPGHYRMFDLVVDVKETAPGGPTVLDIKGGIGVPLKDPAFTYKYFDVPAEEVDGTFTVSGGENVGFIGGQVTNEETSDPINEAFVSADGYSDKTNGNGRYLIEEIPIGTYDVVANAIGFSPDTVQGASVSLGGTTWVDFALTPSECIDRLTAGQGSGVWGDQIEIPIIAENCQELDGYTICFGYDTTFVRATEIETVGTATGAVGPVSMFETHIFRYGIRPNTNWVVVKCHITENHSKWIAPGINTLVNVLFIFKPFPPDTTPIHFDAFPRFIYPEEPIINEFIYGDLTLEPVLDDGFIVELPAFMRGDYDGDGHYTFGDGLSFLGWYFEDPRITPPSCLDAADFNDDGGFSLSDATSFFGWYLEMPGSSPPPPPGATCGADPTLDELTCGWDAFCMTGEHPPLRKPVVKSGSKLILDEGIVDEDGLVRIPLNLSNANKLSGLECTISYDPDLLALEQVDNTGLVSEKFDLFVTRTDVDNGRIRIGFIPSLDFKNSIPEGDWHIATMVFKVKEKSLKRDIPLRIERASLYDTDINELQAVLQNGYVKPQSDLPREFALEPNYPNPFNPTTEIRYTLPWSSYVKLEVYNLLGQRVIKLVDRKQEAGYKSVRWDASSLASGIYFCRLEAGGYVKIGRMLLLK